MFEPRKVGWAVGGCQRVGGTVYNTLKGGNTEQPRGKQILKRGGKLRQGVSALKIEGWNSLMNYVFREKCPFIPLPDTAFNF